MPRKSLPTKTCCRNWTNPAGVKPSGVKPSWLELAFERAVAQPPYRARKMGQAKCGVFCDIMAVFAAKRRAISSAVEHCIHTAGVTCSIHVSPTKITHEIKHLEATPGAFFVMTQFWRMALSRYSIRARFREIFFRSARPRSLAVGQCFNSAFQSEMVNDSYFMTAKSSTLGW